MSQRQRKVADSLGWLALLSLRKDLSAEQKNAFLICGKPPLVLPLAGPLGAVLFAAMIALSLP